MTEQWSTKPTTRTGSGRMSARPVDPGPAGRGGRGHPARMPRVSGAGESEAFCRTVPAASWVLAWTSWAAVAALVGDGATGVGGGGLDRLDRLLGRLLQVVLDLGGRLLGLLGQRLAQLGWPCPWPARPAPARGGWPGAARRSANPRRRRSARRRAGCPGSAAGRPAELPEPRTRPTTRRPRPSRRWSEVLDAAGRGGVGHRAGDRPYGRRRGVGRRGRCGSWVPGRRCPSPCP